MGSVTVEAEAFHEEVIVAVVVEVEVGEVDGEVDGEMPQSFVVILTVMVRAASSGSKHRFDSLLCRL